MGDVLAELEGFLRSRPSKDKLTSGEETVLQNCKARAIRAFTVGACISSAVTWTATKSLTHGQRFNLSVGSAVLAGMWRFNRSLNVCIDQILGLEGSRMQWELASIILTKHQDDASRVELVRKHFYPEQVFNDLNPDKPFFRWRPRHLFADNNAAQMTEEAEDSEYYEKKPVDIQPRKQTRNSGERNAQRSPGGEVIADPLDCIFGEDTSQEITHSDKAGALPRRRLRAHKRAHRRHRDHNAETSVESNILVEQ